MVRFLISTAFWCAALERGRHLSGGGTYFDLNVDGAWLILDQVLIRGNKVCKNFRETSNSYPLIRTRASAYQGVRIASFSESFSYVLNEWIPYNLYIWRFDWLINWVTMLDIFTKGDVDDTIRNGINASGNVERTKFRRNTMVCKV